MSQKKIINIEGLKLALMVLAEFNALDLAEVELREDGKTIPTTPEMLKDFSFIGMSNRTFVESRYWEMTEETVCCAMPSLKRM